MKKINFVWLSPNQSIGQDDLPKSICNNIASFSKFHPDFEVVIWDYSKIYKEFSNDFQLMNAFNLCRFEAMKSDLIRVALIYKFGGFYSDLKNVACQSFLENILFYEKLIIVEHPPTIKNYKNILSNCFIFAPRKNYLLKNILDQLIENISTKYCVGGVTNVTGIHAWKKIISETNDDDFLVVPANKVWGIKGENNGWMKRVSANYNGSNLEQHWSKRQLNESFYYE